MSAISAPVLLPRQDHEYLLQKRLPFEAVQVVGEIHLTLFRFVFPDAYMPNVADLRIVLPAGYANANPDMFWTRPNVMLRTGGFPLRADYIHTFPDGAWQRWSRHFGGAWRPGIDGIKTYLASIRRELSQGI